MFAVTQCISLFFFVLYVDFATSTCLQGWESRGSFCYEFVTQEKTWAESESYCQSKGGHQISFSDASERDWAYHAHIGPSGEKWWTGLNDIDVEGQWVWSDRNPLKDGVIQWRPGEPNNNKEGQHCVTYEGGTAYTANTFNYEPCSRTRYFACKVRADPGEMCDTDRGFVQYGSYCYYVSSQNLNWHDAESVCYQQYDAHLSSVLSDDEQTFLAGKSAALHKGLWIGLSDTDAPGRLSWSNGYDDFTYTQQWADGQPNIVNPGSSCVNVKYADGKWKVDRCSKERPFVCKKGLKTTCPDGWTYGHGKCYQFHLNSNLFITWSEAREYCALQNARLIQIESGEEQNFLSAYYTQWKKEGVLQLWIGASDLNHDNLMRWSDGSNIIYEEWDGDVTSQLQPNVDDCAWLYVGKNNDNWEIGNCFSLQAFGCEINEGISIPDVPPPLINYTCPEGWRLYNEHCYLFTLQKVDWDTAEAYCGQPAQYNSHLVSIHNEGEQSFISGHLKGGSWSGLTDRLYENSYIWSDKTVTDFFNWEFDQPNGDGNCISVIDFNDNNAWGMWNDQDCNEINFAICKMAGISVKPHYPPTQEPSPHESLCGTNYLHNAANHRCYKIEGKYKRQWQRAPCSRTLSPMNCKVINLPSHSNRRKRTH